jgi:phosphate starvation-inducible PhoH-like protein
MLSGPPEAMPLATRVLDELYAIAASGYPLQPSDVDQAVRLLQREPDVRLRELYNETLTLGVGKKRIHPRSPRQRQYVAAMAEHDLVFGIGPAGTGKTFLAMAVAITALMKGEVNRIVLCRPAVEAGEKLGFLPGDLTEKVNPYLRPLYDALNDLVGFDRAGRLIAKGVIEVAPLAFMRGRTLSESYVVLDEGQNSTPEQMKMLLTRIGLNSRVVVTGDLTQVDLPRGQKSGLHDTLDVLHGVPGIAVIRFTDVDVVRHPLVSEIVRAYDRREALRAEAQRESGG